MTDGKDRPECPVCSSANTQRVRYDGYVDALKCHSCGSVRRLDATFGESGDRGPTVVEEKIRVAYDIQEAYEGVASALKRSLTTRCDRDD